MSAPRPAFALLLTLVGATALSTALPACSSGFGSVRGARRLSIELKDADKVTGSRVKPLPLVVDQPQPFRIVVRALGIDGQVDPTFNGFVRISSKPGAVERLQGEDTEGRNILVRNGESREIEVRVTNAYGPTFILADDLGYFPVDPLQEPPPACANGVDDDGDGKLDFPADEGCAFANDDNEEGASYAQGASVPIFYSLPRIADARGLKCEPTCSSSGITPYQKEAIQLDTGYHDKSDGLQRFDFDVVVSRISSDGFYVTDVGDTRGGFNSVFSFNFNAPPRMRVCDRMKTFGGTATGFFGFTQISYPTWTLEEWDPSQRRCLVPDHVRLAPSDLDPTLLLPLSGSLVRAETTDDGAIAVKVTPKFGPNPMPKQAGNFVPTEDATSCDFNKDGRIDFSPGNDEGICSQICAEDPECTEFSNFKARSTFRITITDANKNSRAIQADASASASFDPLAMRGKPLKAFGGTLTYFSGGSQYTVEARCKDDIVVDLASQPLNADRECTTAAECLPGFQCVPLANGQRACRGLDPDGVPREAPPLPCVFPRTFLDNNPQ